MNRFVDDLLLLAKAESPDFLQLETVPLDELGEELFAKARGIGRPRVARDDVLAALHRRRLPAAYPGVMNLVQNAIAHTGAETNRDRGLASRGPRRRSGCAIPVLGSRRASSGASSRASTAVPHSRGRYEGSGLGLAIVRAIAEAHGGRVRVTAGRGTERGSRIVLPIDAGRSRGGVGGRGGHVNRILIVEDDPGMASFLDKGLGSRGYATKAVGDGAEAIAIASDEDFDLVILDLGLPDVDGLSVLREIRRRGERLPVIILTARDDLDDKVEGLDAGAATT